MKTIKKMHSLEEDILLLQNKGKDTALTIGEILDILSEKGQLLIILFFSLPFCQPIQIPGLSTPFGIAIAFIGLRMAFGKYVWLPERILSQSITPQTLKKITDKILWLLKKTDRWIHPRLNYLCSHPASLVFNGILLAILGIMLALPLPVPLSNLMAAWSILLIGLGLLKDDGVFILIGYIVSLITFGSFVAVFLFLKHIF